MDNSYINAINNHVILYGPDALSSISTLSTIILLLSTAMVLFMIPGLGIFYGGLERRKNVNVTIAQSLVSIPITTLIWIFGGFSLAFGPSLGGFIGDPTAYFAFRNILFGNGWSQLGLVTNVTIANGVPFIAFFIFQLAFAIITPALVTGAFAERMNMRGYILFNVLFTLFIYIPVCHWIWGGGFLSQNGAVDWAGGIVIHLTCGVAAIASVIILKRRTTLDQELTLPHSLPLVAVGASILFFGWFGFNVGGATFSPLLGTVEEIEKLLTDGSILSNQSELILVAITAFTNSFIAMACGMLTWLIIDACRQKRTSLLSILTSGVAGLASITPAAGFVPIWASIIIGVIGSGICYIMCILNHRVGFDDALEVWPVHGIGGLVGTILLAAFATTSINPILLGSTQGLSVDQLGSSYLLLWQFIMIIVVIAWTFVFSIIIFKLVVLIKGKTTNLEQMEGLDKTLFNEFSYTKEMKKTESDHPLVYGKELKKNKLLNKILKPKLEEKTKE